VLRDAGTGRIGDPTVAKEYSSVLLAIFVTSGMESSVDHLLQAFSPQVVIFSDENVDRACEVNGCKGLDQLFKPWQSTIERGMSNVIRCLCLY
jgi:hypothetical protein